MKNPSFESTPQGEEKNPEEIYKLQPHEQVKIKELETPLAEILEQLRPEIERGEYSAIIGDDASGRIPSLILWEVIGEIYKKNDLPPPLMRFIAGSSRLLLSARAEKEMAVDEQMARIEKDTRQDNKKFLIATDTIASGASVDVLMAAIKKNGLRADVATIGLISSDRDRARIEKELEKRWGNKVVCGMIGTPDIYQATRISGVVKDPKNLFSNAIARNFEKDQQLVNNARELSHEVAHNLLEEFNTNTKDKE